MYSTDMYGSFIQPTKRWTGGFVEISAPNVGQTPPEELRVDPFLPALTNDPYDPAGGIAIPAGRFVGLGRSENVGGNSFDAAGAVASTANLYRMGQVERGYTLLTTHDGKNITPVGLSVNNIFRSTGQNSSGNPVTGGAFQNVGNVFGTDSGASASDTKFRRGFLAAVPFVLQINNAHGAVLSGDSLTGYWGSTTSTSNIGFVHRGKPVKWTAPALKYQSFTASGTVVLTEAIYPGITPRMVAIWNSSTPVASPSTTTFAFNGTNWVATLPASATQVLYEYGQSAEQIGGECVRIQSLAETKSRDELFKFVEVARDDYLNFPPPPTQRQAVTVKTQESANAVTAGSIYRVRHAPISVLHSIIVEVQGTVIDPTTAVATTYASSDWFTLPNGPQLSSVASLYGLYHNVNWRTGVIELSANVTATAVRVTYSSIDNERTGAVLWGAGIEGLTDGRYVNSAIGSAGAMLPSNGNAGIPAYLNFADVVGELRFLVKN